VDVDRQPDGGLIQNVVVSIELVVGFVGVTSSFDIPIPGSIGWTIGFNLPTFGGCGRTLTRENLNVCVSGRDRQITFLGWILRWTRLLASLS